MIPVWYWFRRQVEQTPQTQDMSELEEEIYSTEQFNSQSSGADDDFIESKSIINNHCHAIYSQPVASDTALDVSLYTEILASKTFIRYISFF